MLAFKLATKPKLSSKELERGSSEPYECGSCDNGSCDNVLSCNASFCSKAHSKELVRSKREQERHKVQELHSKEQLLQQQQHSKELGLARSKQEQRHSK